MNDQPYDQVRAPRRSRIPALSVFEYRDFRFIWGSDVLDSMCRWMELVILTLLMLRETDSPFWVALVGTMRFAPMLLFGIFAGLIADRVNRWYVLVTARGANILITTVLLVLIINDWIEPWHILLGALALGWTFTLDMPSRQSFIYDLVGPQNVVRAQSMVVINFTLGRIAGPSLAGLMIETTGYGGAYMLVLAVYFPTWLLISRVRRDIPRLARASQPLWESLASGLRYSLQNRVILGLLGVTLIMNFMGFSAQQLFPVVARDHLHVGEGLTGVLLSADGIGMLIGAVIIGSLGTITHHGRIFAMGSALVLLAIILFALSPWYFLSFLILMVAGLGNAGFGTMQSSIMLLSAAPERRGTAIGVLSLCIGAGPLGMLELGAMATLLSPQVAIGINATTGLLLMVPVLLLTPLAMRPTAPPASGSGLGESARPTQAPRPENPDDSE